MKIFKYPIPLKERPIVKMPAYAKILSFQEQVGQGMQIWCLVDENETTMINAPFLIVGTGNQIPNDILIENAKFVGTVQQGRYVWHLFDMRSPQWRGH